VLLKNEADLDWDALLDAVARAPQRLVSRVPMPTRELKRLRILAPEAHDLALMKGARISPLSLATLSSRAPAAGPFGEEEATRVDREIR
jgi:hypothetical protein